MKCNNCKKYTPSHAFATFRNRDGSIGRRGVCKECRGKYAKDNFEELKKWRKQYYKKNKTKKSKDAAIRRKSARDIIDAIKESTRCCDCGKLYPAVAMDFDHIKGKNKSISSMVSQAYKLELIMAEIELCEIVCACCHRIRTSKRKQNLGRKIKP